MGISLVTTVKNEEHSILQFLESVKAQTKHPDEVIIVDGGSGDRTVSLIASVEDLEIKVITVPCNISRGRNIAIHEARCDIIAVTDAGCRLDRRWLERITAFGDSVDVTVGGYRPIIGDLFDACQYSLMGLFESRVNASRFSISSRSLAFRKRVWKELGGYPEWLDYSEDMYFHQQFFKKGYEVRLCLDAVVEWEQRTSVRGVYRQFFRYMEGDGIAKMHTKRHIVRFGTYLTGLVLLMLSFQAPVFLVPLVIGFVTYLSVPCSAFVRLRAFPFTFRVVLMIVFLVLVMDAGKMFGYLSGLYKATRKSAVEA